MTAFRVFVSVGSQLPFERLITAMDAWAGYNQAAEVFAQIGDTRFVPVHMEHVRTLAPADYAERFDQASVVVKLTYAANLESLQSVADSERYSFRQLDICDLEAMKAVLSETSPDAIMHLAAESHVDRSIDGAAEFIQTNVVGTFTLLEATRGYWQSLDDKRRAGFRFHHVSTDEVYGDLEGTDALFTEDTPYEPSSPYSASKASSDHLVRAWQRTYGLPVVITNCSNNYGPFHFPEKLIPLTILNALHAQPLPAYGKGEQIRDWLYVEDHARALAAVIETGANGRTYNIGGHNEQKNIDVVKRICSLLEELAPAAENSAMRDAGKQGYEALITYVTDRPGHDARYAIDASRIDQELGWHPAETFETSLRKTVQWYLDNRWWWAPIRAAKYAGERIGLNA